MVKNSRLKSCRLFQDLEILTGLVPGAQAYPVRHKGLNWGQLVEWLEEGKPTCKHGRVCRGCTTGGDND